MLSPTHKQAVPVYYRNANNVGKM